MASVSKAPKRRPLMIRVGDEVQVIAGRDRGKRGRVLRVESAKERVYVSGLNMVKRNTRPEAPVAQKAKLEGNETADEFGGVIEVEGPIPVANVIVLDPNNGKPTWVAIKRPSALPTMPPGGTVTPRPVFDALAGKLRQLSYKAGERGRCQRIHDHREGRRRGARRPNTRQPGERR